MKQYKNLITTIGLCFIWGLFFCSCSKDDDNNAKSEEVKIQLAKKEVELFVTRDQSIKVIGIQQESLVATSEDEFIASVTVEADGIKIKARHVGETKIHVSQNGTEEICLVKCVTMTADWIGWTIMDFGISKVNFKEAVKEFQYHQLSEIDNTIVIIQKILTLEEVKTTYYFDDGEKLYRIKKELEDNTSSSPFIRSSMDEYYEFEGSETSPKDQIATYPSGSYFQVTTRYIYKYPNKGYAVYHQKDRYSDSKTEIKSNTKNIIFFSPDKESAIKGF